VGLSLPVPLPFAPTAFSSLLVGSIT